MVMRTTTIIDVLILTSLCFIYEQKEADASDTNLRDITNCMKIGSSDMEECMKTLMESEKDFYNRLSEYFMKRSSYQVVQDECRTESGSFQSIIRELRQETQSQIENLKNEMKAQFEELKSGTEDLKSIMRNDIHQSILKIHAAEQDVKVQSDAIMASVNDMKEVMTMDSERIIQSIDELKDSRNMTEEVITHIAMTLDNVNEIEEDLRMNSEKLMKSVEELKYESRNMTGHVINRLEMTLSNVNKVKEDMTMNSEKLMKSVEEGKYESRNLTEMLLTRLQMSLWNVSKSEESIIINLKGVMKSIEDVKFGMKMDSENIMTSVNEVKEGMTMCSEKIMKSIENVNYESKREIHKVITVLYKAILFLEEMKEDAKHQFSRLSFLPNIAKQDSEYSLIYTDAMRKSVRGKTFELGLPAILCNSSGVFIIDWNSFKTKNWIPDWTNMLGGIGTGLFSCVLLPGNGILSYLHLAREGSNLILQAVYSDQDIILNRPASIKIYFHVKVIIPNGNAAASSTIITKTFQQAQISRSWSTIVAISSPVWNKFSKVKLPILEFHLVAMENNY